MFKKLKLAYIILHVILHKILHSYYFSALVLSFVNIKQTVDQME